MSFHKGNINDYVNDIPMRFSNSFTQIAPNNHLKLNDLNSIYVDRLSASDYDYDFSAERIALEDAQRERERVLKEAEQKMRELELSNQLNETQVKKPVEDVINSPKPIQLTTTPISMVDYNAQTGQNNETNHASNANYAPPISSIYTNIYNYNNSPTVQKRTKQQTNLTPTQSHLSQNVNVQSSTISSNITVPNTQITSVSQSPPASLPYSQPSVNHFSIATINSSLENNNITRNSSINLPLNGQASPKLNNELSKEHHHSDNSLQLSNINQLGNNSNHQNSRSNVNSIYSPGHYSQSHSLHTQVSNSQSNYSNYSPIVTSSTINYPMNSSIYNPHFVYHQPMTHQIQSNDHANDTINTIPKENHVKPNSSMNQFNSANYVPSSTPYSMSGILMPQQSSSFQSNTSDGKHKNSDKNSINRPFNKVNDNSNNSTPNSSQTSLNASTSTTNQCVRPNGKKIDVADFENSSSPFDDALLRSIDDKEELNNIFQQFYHNGAK